MKKKILVVDDSALMRKVLCDIIKSDSRFEVSDVAVDGIEGLEKIKSNSYDAVVLDVYMPRMTGLQMLKKMQEQNIYANVLMASTTTSEGAKETIEALELGAIDFIKKFEKAAEADNDFRKEFLSLLYVVANTRKRIAPVRRAPVMPAVTPGSRAGSFTSFGTGNIKQHAGNMKLKPYTKVTGRKIVAIASSTGGPKALMDVIPYLPGNLKAPVLLVQHMPKGFTASLAERLNAISKVKVSEAKEGDVLENGHVYIAPGGAHMKVTKKNGVYSIILTDEPAREGVKPCANYMYESLMDSNFDEVVCAVMTGMGADGTAGIKALNNKKKIFVVAQDEESSTVYGMPKAIAQTGLCNSIVTLTDIAEQITQSVGVN